MKIVLPCYSMLYSLVPFMFLLTSRSCLASLAPRAAVATWRPPLGGLATSDLRHEDVYTLETSCIARCVGHS